MKDPLDPPQADSQVDALADALAEAGLLSAVPRHDLPKVLASMQRVSARAGNTVFRDGDPGDAMYLVISGRLRLERLGVPIVVRGPRDLVGEFSLIDEQPRSASAVAESDVELLRWDRSSFQALIGQYPSIATGIFRTLTSKLREDIDTHVSLVLEQERIRQDLTRAREIQMSMLPPGEPAHPDFGLAGLCRPAAEVGGDFYDYLSTAPDRLGVVIADVTGHGFYAGLFVAMVKSGLHAQATVDDQPRAIMDAMRRTLALSIEPSMLMSCCYALLDGAAGTLRYANAGHPPPLVHRAAHDVQEWLEPVDPLLGALAPEESRYEERALQWATGDVLVMYSDGITEARAPDGEEFGAQRLATCVRRHAAHGGAAVRDAVLDAVTAHCAGRLPDDDLTLVVVKGGKTRTE